VLFQVAQTGKATLAQGAHGLSSVAFKMPFAILLVQISSTTNTAIEAAVLFKHSKRVAQADICKK
jgi:hypothetical protein